VAELLKRELNVQTELVRGDSGEFTVWVKGECVAKKSWLAFPSEEKVLEAVRQALVPQPA
jgi:hypothetical protein